ncbi:MAG: ParA family protein [Alphaproteobacteria bacterium]|jgi:chromosome partitioning protein|nr:ParA family protein [Alphaproteobacteria bacterium]
MTNRRIIFFVNQKGGSGKSTLAFNVAIAISKNQNYKVALIDTDPQCSLYSIMEKREENNIKSNLYFATSFLNTLSAELKKCNDMDYIIVDTQGSASGDIIQTCKNLNAKVIVPMLPNFLDIEATNPLLEILIENHIEFKVLLNGIHHSGTNQVKFLKESLKEDNINTFDNYLIFRSIYKKPFFEGLSVVEIEDNVPVEFNNFMTETINWK